MYKACTTLGPEQALTFGRTYGVFSQGLLGTDIVCLSVTFEATSQGFFIFEIQRLAGQDWYAENQQE